jgi:hypothetical protein
MSNEAGPMETVRSYADAFNKGGREDDGGAFRCVGVDPRRNGTSSVAGSDSLPGPVRDVLKEGEHVGAGGYFIALGEPSHVDVAGDSGYVVVLATMTFKLRDRQITQSGATYTVALQGSV